MKKTTKSGKVFNDEELRRALFAFQDLMERLGGCVFYPLRTTAEQLEQSGRFLAAAQEMDKHLKASKPWSIPDLCRRSCGVRY